MSEAKAKLFHVRQKGPMMERENWYSYLKAANDEYVIHEWSLFDLKGKPDIGAALYTVKEFLENDQFNGSPKIKLQELLRNQ